MSKYIVRKELLEATRTIPDHLKNLPKVISFDEFKADTKEGKYAFILNDPIRKKVLDILPKRKKEYLKTNIHKIMLVRDLVEIKC